MNMPDSSLPEFAPRGLLASPHVQSLLTSGPWRRRKVRKRAADYLARCEERILTAADGTRLLGFANRPRADRRDALVILLHGWEGSADSNYLLSTAVTLDQAGFDTFRLNFRDHGDTHHLNEGLFHSCLLGEVLDAVSIVAGDYKGPVFLAGFSLGGNFTLRIARHAPGHGLDIRRAIAISPVIRPHHVLDAMEQGLPIYERYFVHKWRRSLRHKQSLYPERYNLQPWFKLGRVRAQTEWLINHQTDFESLDAYLEGYSVAGNYLADLETSTLIITAADDPIIPISDFEGLPRPPALDLEILPHGGHCGFLSSWRLESWIEDRIKSELCRLTQN